MGIKYAKMCCIYSLIVLGEEIYFMLYEGSENVYENKFLYTIELCPDHVLFEIKCNDIASIFCVFLSGQDFGFSR